MSISACYIVKNEQDNLPRSINSILGAVSEIIVVDTGSTDSTVETAKSLGPKVRVEFFDWIGDFSAAKNFALSMASNEIVIFPDADEWFVPPLTEKDAGAIAGIFGSDPALGAVMVPLHNLNGQGAITIVNPTLRILRKREGMSFHGRIHEYYANDDGKSLKSVISEDLKIYHSGYAEDIMPAKMERNIKLLEETASSSPDPQERHLAHCYLVREYFQAGDTAGSAEHLKSVLAEPDMIRKQCLSLGEGFAALTYNMLQTAHSARNTVSRAELRRKLVEPFKRYIPQYPGAATIDLFFNCLFGAKDDVLLREIGPALEMAGKLPPSQNNFHVKAESLINRFAAQALGRRGRAVEAMEYALKSFREMDDLNPAGLRILLNCLRGQPPEEIILFLNSQFDTSSPQKLAFLCEGTYFYGFNAVYSYYLNKKIEASMATADEYLSVFLARGAYAEAVKAALEFLADRGEAAMPLVSEKLFLAAVCSGDEGIYRDNAAILENYSRLLDAFFAGLPLESPSDSDAGMLIALFEPASFCAGIECGERLLSLLGDAYALPAFRAAAKYCAENGLYGHLLSRRKPASIDIASTRYIIECFVLAGRYGEAFELLEKLLGSGVCDEVLLQYLSAVAEGGAIPAAEKLYGEYTRLLDHYINLNDVINTGYIFDDSDKKKARAIKSLTNAQFKKLLDTAAASPPLLGLAELAEKTGGIYEQRGFLADAVDSYSYALVKNHNADTNRENLARVLKAIGNTQIRL